MGTKTNEKLYSDGLLNHLKEQAADVLLKPKGSDSDTAISAHKLILSARSNVFKKMFKSNKGKATTKPETITLSEFDLEELDAFVGFIYSDGSMLSKKAKQHVWSLHRAAGTYKIPHLQDLCRNTIYASINSTKFKAFDNHSNLTVKIEKKPMSGTAGTRYCPRCGHYIYYS